MGGLLGGLSDRVMREVERDIEAMMQAEIAAEVARVALNQFVRGGKSPTAAQLTKREREVITQVAEGLSNKAIAAHLGVGVRTVETHRERIMKKLDIHNAAGLTKFAITRGLVSVGSKPPV